MALESRKISGLIGIKHWLPEDHASLTKQLLWRLCRALLCFGCAHPSAKGGARKGSRKHGGWAERRNPASFLAELTGLLQTETLHISRSLSFEASFARLITASSSPYQILPMYSCTGSSNFVRSAQSVLFSTDPHSSSDDSGYEKPVTSCCLNRVTGFNAHGVDSAKQSALLQHPALTASAKPTISL